MARPLGFTRPSRHVEAAFIATAVKWGETYVAQVERDNGIPPRSLPVPGRGQFTVSSEQFEKWPETQTPAVLVLAPGLAGDPHVESDKTLTAPVAIGIAILTSSTIPDVARDVAQLLGAAYRQMFLNARLCDVNGDTVDWFDGIDYRDERYGDIPGSSERNMSGCRLVFTVWVRNWADVKGQGMPRNPDTPAADPYVAPAGWPTVLPNQLFPSITVNTPSEGIDS